MTNFDDMEDHETSDIPAGGSRLGRWVNLSGAVVSLALVGGLSVWGYQLLMRDVNGVPVVQAMEGAFRVAPEDPGGMQAPHQGLAVNEIAAEGEAGGPAEEVTLAPPPVELAEEDATAADFERMAEEAAAAEEAERAAELAESQQAAELLRRSQAASRAAGIDDGAGPAIAELEDDAFSGDEETSTALVEDAPEGALDTDRAVAEALAGIDMGETDADRAAEIAVTADEAGAEIVSPRPAPRPAQLIRASAEIGDTDAATLSSGPAPEVDVAELETGTRMVQLGAFASSEVAREEWERIAGRFPAYFDGKRRVVQEAASGGNTFYRLRAEGFVDLADTRRFCTELLARQTDCIPVELR